LESYLIVIEVEAVKVEEAFEESVAFAYRVSRHSKVSEGSQDLIETLLVLYLIESAEMSQHFLHFDLQLLREKRRPRAQHIHEYGVGLSRVDGLSHDLLVSNGGSGTVEEHLHRLSDTSK
jgi:hypothetical protein